MQNLRRGWTGSNLRPRLSTVVESDDDDILCDYQLSAPRCSLLERDTGDFSHLLDDIDRENADLSQLVVVSVSETTREHSTSAACVALINHPRTVGRYINSIIIYDRPTSWPPRYFSVLRVTRDCNSLSRLCAPSIARYDHSLAVQHRPPDFSSSFCHAFSPRWPTTGLQVTRALHHGAQTPNDSR